MDYVHEMRPRGEMPGAFVMPEVSVLPGEHGDIWIWWGGWDPGDLFDTMITRRRSAGRRHAR